MLMARATCVRYDAASVFPGARFVFEAVSLRGVKVILFVNACVRGEKSRTLALCRAYLAGARQLGAKVREVNLEQVRPMPLSEQKVAFRSQLARAGIYEDDVFDFSHQFAEADDIVIGAPYWDLSFPASLKVYIEHVSVDGITFRYTPEGHYEKLCRARRITYITTAGCFLGGAEADEREEKGREAAEGGEASAMISPYAHRGRFAPAPGCNLGYDYICAIAKMFGIEEVRYVAAEGLDVAGADVKAQMDKARHQISQLLADDGLEAQA